MSETQREKARQRANNVRIARARLRLSLKTAPARTAQHMAAAMIMEPPDYLANLTLMAYLQWIPNIGRTRALKILNKIPCSEMRTINQLTPANKRQLQTILGNKNGAE